jgi:diaminopimelate epimerase
MMPLEFSKLSAAGNDFVLLHDPSSALAHQAARLAQTLCRRRFSVGADGLLMIRAAIDDGIRVDYFNADGSEAGLCANGVRCAALFASLKGVARSPMTLYTARGMLRAWVDGTQVSCTLPIPEGPRAQRVRMPDGRQIPLWWANTGVPHAVVFLSGEEGAAIDASVLPLAEATASGEGAAPVAFAIDAPLLRWHRVWGAAGSNVDFAWREESGGLAMRSWERGVEAETLACGTGTVAVALAAAAAGWRKQPIAIRNRGGAVSSVELAVSVAGELRPLLRGPVSHLFDGVVAPHALSIVTQRSEG